MLQVDRAFDEVLAGLVERNKELGLQVCAYQHGELVLDSWGGFAAPGSDAAVDADTLFCIMSVSKAITAIALHLQADRGLIKYGSPVAKYWPEYGTRGKQGTTVFDALTHRAGVPLMPVGTTPERLGDWDWMTSRIADMVPLFEPGTKMAYHAMSYGWIVGEIVRRTDPKGRSFAQFVRGEICEPLGITDFYFGVPDELHRRIAGLDDALAPTAVAGFAPGVLGSAVKPANISSTAVRERADVRRFCLPAVGGVATARAVARIFAMLERGGELDGVRLLSEATVRLIATPGPPVLYDYTYGTPHNITMGGFHSAAPIGDQPPPVPMSLAGGPSVFGHPGNGGQLAWVDPDAGLAVAAFRNRLVSLEHLDRSANPLSDVVSAVKNALS